MVDVRPTPPRIRKTPFPHETPPPPLSLITPLKQKIQTTTTSRQPQQPRTEPLPRTPLLLPAPIRVIPLRRRRLLPVHHATLWRSIRALLLLLVVWLWLLLWLGTVGGLGVGLLGAIRGGGGGGGGGGAVGLLVVVGGAGGRGAVVGGGWVGGGWSVLGEKGG